MSSFPQNPPAAAFERKHKNRSFGRMPVTPSHPHSGTGSGGSGSREKSADIPEIPRGLAYAPQFLPGLEGRLGRVLCTPKPQGIKDTHGLGGKARKWGDLGIPNTVLSPLALPLHFSSRGK